MSKLEEQLRQYIVAISDPTRAAILMELERVGELTATQLARRLDLTANNIYHHMRILLRLGVVNAPRIVPGETYVEKYYSVKQELIEARQRDPAWVDHTQATMTPEERKEMAIGFCLRMAQVLRRAAQRYETMATEEFERLFYQPRMLMLSLNDLSQERYEHRLAALRNILAQEQDLFPLESTQSPQPNMVLMAALPLLWEEENGERK